MIIASAIEEHQKNSLILITTDKKDWKQEYITNPAKMHLIKKFLKLDFSKIINHKPKPLLYM